MVRLNAAIQHAGINAQSDRVALNKSQTHLQELQHSYSMSETARAKYENQLHEERQEHRLTQENLNQERRQLQETQRNLGWVWSAHTRLGDILSRVSGHDFGRSARNDVAPWNISDLLLELEAKTTKIAELQATLNEPQPRLGAPWKGGSKSTEQSKLQMAFNTPRPGDKRADWQRRSLIGSRPQTWNDAGESINSVKSEGNAAQDMTTVKVEQP